MRNFTLNCMLVLACLSGICAVTMFSACAVRESRPQALGLPVVMDIVGNGYAATCVPFLNTEGKLWCVTVKHTTDTATHVGDVEIVDVFEHPTRDFAIVSIMSAFEPTLRFSNTPPAPGDELVSIGRQFTAIRYMDGRAGGRLGTMSCPIIPGASGGAVLNASGELVGVIKSVMARDTSEGPIWIPHVSNFTPVHDLAPWIAAQIYP